MQGVRSAMSVKIFDDFKCAAQWPHTMSHSTVEAFPKTVPLVPSAYQIMFYVVR
jgi:hypothetical protein